MGRGMNGAMGVGAILPNTLTLSKMADGNYGMGSGQPTMPDRGRLRNRILPRGGMPTRGRRIADDSQVFGGPGRNTLSKMAGRNVRDPGQAGRRSGFR